MIVVLRVVIYIKVFDEIGNVKFFDWMNDNSEYLKETSSNLMPFSMTVLIELIGVDFIITPGFIYMYINCFKTGR